MNAYMLMPKMQLVGNYTQNGEDAAYIGGARAVAFQFFADGWGGGGSGGSVVFTIEHATSNNDDHFVDSSATATINQGSSSEIVVKDINVMAAYVRVKAVVSLNTNTSVDVKVQMNVMGGR